MCAAAEAVDSWLANILIGEVFADAVPGFAAKRWRARLGKNSRIVARLVHGPSGFLSAGERAVTGIARGHRNRLRGHLGTRLFQRFAPTSCWRPDGRAGGLIP